MRFAGLPALLSLLAFACNPSNSGSTGAVSASEATDASTTLGAGSTEHALTGTDASASSASSTDSSATVAGTSTGSTTAPDPTTAAHTTGSTGSQTSGDTGGPASCGVANADYGDCAVALGFAFDGTECTPRSGCNCAPDCDKFFPDLASCALSCADAGYCNDDRIKAGGGLPDPIVPGTLCLGIYVCPVSADLELVFKAIFGALSCEQVDFPCQGGNSCQGLDQNTLGPEDWKKTCAASLVPDSGDIFCLLLAP